MQKEAQARIKINKLLEKAEKPRNRFTDITKKAGIDFKYTIGDFSYKNIIESSGSGITVFDYNNDNLMDLFLMNGTYLEGISDPRGRYSVTHMTNFTETMGMAPLLRYRKRPVWMTVTGAWLPVLSIMIMMVIRISTC